MNIQVAIPDLRKTLSMDMAGIPMVGDTIDLYDVLSANERQRYRVCKVVKRHWMKSVSTFWIPMIEVSLLAKESLTEHALPS